MEKFTASNGIVFTFPEDGSFRWEAGHPPAQVSQALREVVLHERDQELGRWRWPENPDVVVYVSNVNENRVRALSESTGHSEWSQRGSESNDWYGRAARAYFAAHPEPKPWHHANPGEVWELTTRGVDDRWNPTAFYVGVRESGAHTIEAAFFPVESDYSVTHLGLRATAITAGRRIWPEVSDD